MSFNASSSKSKSQQTASSQQSLDPQIKQTLLDNVARTQGIAGTPFQPYTGQFAADFTPDQQQAQNLFSNLAGQQNGTLASGVSAAQNLTGYSPSTVSGVDRGSIGNVSGGTISPEDIAKYLNPYTSDVINTSMSDLERQRQIEQTYNSAKATAGHAFGGTGAAIQAGQTNDSYGRTAAGLIAQLRSAGYDNATGLATNDLNRSLTAQQANQGADLSTANLNQQGQIANQNAGLTGAGLNLDAAKTLGTLGTAQTSDQLAKGAALAQSGSEQQANAQKTLDALYQQYGNQQNWPIILQQLLNQSTGLLGNPVLGSSQAQGSSSGSSAGFGFGIPLPIPA